MQIENALQLLISTFLINQGKMHRNVGNLYTHLVLPYPHSGSPVPSEEGETSIPKMHPKKSIKIQIVFLKNHSTNQSKYQKKRLRKRPKISIESLSMKAIFGHEIFHYLQSKS